jgi:glycosyltransferase involved in cell wall biosynthesis
MTPVLSVVVTTYNRAAILARCLEALLLQAGSESYEVLVVDDGSTDETADLLDRLEADSPLLRSHRQPNGGRAIARNAGLAQARGEYLCYVDSDVVVVPTFVAAHLAAHRRARGDRPVFVQGLSINIHDWAQIGRVSVPPFDPSRAFFDTKNVSIRRAHLEEVGGFDTGFVEYGWEDLELGVRLKARGLGIVRSREALGYHFHPAFTVQDLPKLRRIEEERGRMAARFLAMHPTLDVRLMTQDTPLHEVLNAIATWGGFWDEVRIRPFLAFLESKGRVGLAAQVAQIVLNQYNLRELRRAQSGATQNVTPQAASQAPD